MRGGGATGERLIAAASLSLLTFILLLPFIFAHVNNLSYKLTQHPIRTQKLDQLTSIGTKTHISKGLDVDWCCPPPPPPQDKRVQFLFVERVFLQLRCPIGSDQNPLQPAESSQSPDLKSPAPTRSRRRLCVGAAEWAGADAAASINPALSHVGSLVICY